MPQLKFITFILLLTATSFRAFPQDTDKKKIGMQPAPYNGRILKGLLMKQVNMLHLPSRA